MSVFWVIFGHIRLNTLISFEQNEITTRFEPRDGTLEHESYRQKAQKEKNKKVEKVDLISWHTHFSPLF